jgi:dihydroneopterin aldolase
VAGHIADRISIVELELHARVGVTDDERSKPQRIRLNVTVWPNHPFDELNDEIDRTVNYVELCRVSRELIEKRDWKLIETIASELASHLLATFSLAAAEIEVHKFVLPNTSHVAVTARRERTR